MRILIASETFYPDLNGAARFTERLARGLAQSGYKVALVVPGTKFKDEIEESDNIKIFRMKSFPLRPIHPYFRAVLPINMDKKIAQIIKQTNPQIIHLQTHFTIGRACLRQAKKMNIPIIGTNHFMPENLLEYFPHPLRKIVPKLMWSDLAKIFRNLDYITVPSYTSLDLLKNLGIKNKITVISNGINLEAFKKIKVNDAVFEQFDLNKDLFTFIFVGRLEKDKNIDLILEAAKLALKKKPIQIIIVGKGRDADKLLSLHKRLKLSKRVVFTGDVNDNELKSLLSLADAYIASGSAELQGIAVMEAMACGLPILALAAIALPELVKDGLNGFLFQFSKEDLSAKMLKIMEVDREKLETMGKNSLQLIRLHNQDATLKKFEDLYEKIL